MTATVYVAVVSGLGWIFDFEPSGREIGVGLAAVFALRAHRQAAGAPRAGERRA